MNLKRPSGRFIINLCNLAPITIIIRPQKLAVVANKIFILGNLNMDVIMVVRFTLLVLLSTAFFVSVSSHAATCPASTENISNVTQCTVEGSASNIQLNFLSGFNSISSTSSQGGNNGTTVGEQRRLAFIKAAETLADQIVSATPIIVDASFSALECDANSAVLGSAGATTHQAFNGSPHPKILADTFYPISLINSIAQFDIAEEVADIEADFNQNLGNSNCLSNSMWYYGFDTPPSNQYISFTSVLTHEMTHGLGFASLANPLTGEKAMIGDESGNFAGYLDDIFSTFLYSITNNRTWSDPLMSDTGRRTSAKSYNGLAWSGGHVNSQAVGVLADGFIDNDGDSTFSAGDCALMYTPNPVESGSSISHFTDDAYPNELMEPRDTGDTDNLGLALYLLQDIGWETQPSASSYLKTTGCGAYPDESTITQSNSETLDLVVEGLSNEFTYELQDKNGDPVETILTKNGQTINIPYPDSGEFAGEYTLTLTDGAETISINIIRPLRLVWSATNFMDNHDVQTLTIEGGAAGTQYTIEQSPVQSLAVFVENTETQTATAKADSLRFNPAIFKIESSNHTEIETLKLTVSSSDKYPAAKLENASIYPSREYSLHIRDSENKPLSGVSVRLSDSAFFEKLNLETNYTSDQDGNVNFYLPDSGRNVIATIISRNSETRLATLNPSFTDQTIYFEASRSQIESPAFGSSGGGSLPMWLLILFGFLGLPKLRYLSQP